MNRLNKIGFEFFDNNLFDVDLKKFVLMFHKWIQKQDFEGHLLFDVADYTHVPSGPGILLVSHEGNLTIKNTKEGLCFGYVRKTNMDGDFQTKLKSIFSSCIEALRRIESEESHGYSVQFDKKVFKIYFNDRLSAGNSLDFSGSILPEISDFIAKQEELSSHKVSSIQGDKRARLTFKVSA